MTTGQHGEATDAAVRLIGQLGALKKHGPVRADAGSRMVARIIDLMIVFGSSLVISVGIAVVAREVLGVELIDEDLRSTAAGTAVSWISLAAIVAYGTAYEIVLTWIFGGTPGKRRLQLRVVELDGRLVGLGASAARFATWAVPWAACVAGWNATFPDRGGLSLVFFFGALASLGLMASAIRNSEGMGIHDRVARTMVVDENAV